MAIAGRKQLVVNPRGNHFYLFGASTVSGEQLFGFVGSRGDNAIRAGHYLALSAYSSDGVVVYTRGRFGGGQSVESSNERKTKVVLKLVAHRPRKPVVRV